MKIEHLTSDQVDLTEDLSAVFGEVSDAPETYRVKRPGSAYRRGLLGSDKFIALAALVGGEVVGGPAACELGGAA